MEMGWTFNAGLLAKLLKTVWAVSHLPAAKALGLLTCGVYSLRETPDVVSSSDAYAARFAGPVGQWLLSEQNRALLSMLQPFAGSTVLDVGGGHGQYSKDLVEAGYPLTVVGSRAACAHRIQGLVQSGRCTFVEGDLLCLPWGDQSSDVVISFRQLSHLTDWRAFLGELTRVAGKCVVIDFPPSRSFNVLRPVLFPLKRAIENGTTRPYVSFRESDVRRELESHGFRVTGRRPLFGLPMVLHRKLNRLGLSRRAEALAGRMGWTRLFGSPLILRAERI